MQHMFMEAIKSLNDVRVTVNFPQDKFKAQDAAQKMAAAVEAWTNWDFERFGFELGELFRELVMLAFPRQYSVDASGRLRRYSQSHAMNVGKQSFPMSTLVLGGFAVSFLVSLL